MPTLLIREEVEDLPPSETEPTGGLSQGLGSIQAIAYRLSVL